MGLAFTVATAFCWGASTTFGRGAMMEIDFKTGTALRYLIGSVAERIHGASLATAPVLKDMLGLLVVAAITPTFLYFAGLARTRAQVATFAEMAQTFASLLITWGVLHDALSAQQVVAGIVLLVAVAFINQSVEVKATATATA